MEDLHEQGLWVRAERLKTEWNAKVALNFGYLRIRVGRVFAIGLLRLFESAVGGRRKADKSIAPRYGS